MDYTWGRAVMVNAQNFRDILYQMQLRQAPFLLQKETPYLDTFTRVPLVYNLYFKPVREWMPNNKNAWRNPVILLNPSRGGSCWKSLSNFFLSFPFSLSVSILILIFPLSHSVYGLHSREIACKGKIKEYEIAILEQNERKKLSAHIL